MLVTIETATLHLRWNVAILGKAIALQYKALAGIRAYNLICTDPVSRSQIHPWRPPCSATSTSSSSASTSPSCSSRSPSSASGGCRSSADKLPSRAKTWLKRIKLSPELKSWSTEIRTQHSCALSGTLLYKSNLFIGNELMSIKMIIIKQNICPCWTL